MKKQTLKEKLDSYINEKILKQNLEDIVGQSFGRYSKYIIQERALPDVRDGLKPVQRRILYGMQRLGMFSDKPYKKSARIVGEVMGKYHPHGDSSIYEAMVRMSQDWKVRELLIDMHGNNGSIDGDPAAAMRYTEARLSKQAELLLEDLDKRTVDFVPNFDDEELEPIVLPSRFPNLLVNGAQGISAGYATDIPPHNLSEIINAVILRLTNPDATLAEIMQIVKGPDFPTGGIIQGIDGIKDAYKTGKGKIIVRSKTHDEDVRKDVKAIVITEIPYDVEKAALVKRIDEIRLSKKIEGIAEVRDESDREGLRISVELKKEADYNLILNYLFKHSDLQRNYNFNMVAISSKRPVQMGIIQILDAYIAHQKEVITNRSNFELHKCEQRVHILEGLIKMLDVIDQVIEIIRKSKNKSNAKDNLSESFGFTEKQAEAIVTLQLYRLSTTDIKELNQEFTALTKEIAKLKAILSSENKLLNVIKDELKSIDEKFKTPRRSTIEEEIAEIKITEEDLVKEEDVMVVVTKEGYVKRTPIRSFNQTEGGLGLKEDDIPVYQEELTTLNDLLIFTSIGNYVFLPAYKIPESKWKDLGTHINNIVHLADGEEIVKVLGIKDFKDGRNVLITTASGLVKQTALKDFEVQRFNKPIRAIKLKEDDRLVCVKVSSTSKDEIVSVSKLGMIIRYNENEVSVVGTHAQGVKAITLGAGDQLVGSSFTNKENMIILGTSKGTIKSIYTKQVPLTLRARKGTKILPKGKTEITTISEINNKQIEDKVACTVYTTKEIVEHKVLSLKPDGTDFGKKVLNITGDIKNVRLEHRDDTYVPEPALNLFGEVIEK